MSDEGMEQLREWGYSLQRQLAAVTAERDDLTRKLDGFCGVTAPELKAKVRRPEAEHAPLVDCINTWLRQLGRAGAQIDTKGDLQDAIDTVVFAAQGQLENRVKKAQEGHKETLGRLEAETEARIKAEAENARLRTRFPLPVVCICGSTRFADEHAIARWSLERTGRYICVMINYLPAGYAADQGWQGNDHFGEAAGIKQLLDDLHKRKIDLADMVLVVAPGGYIGESTRAEIAYAKGLDRPIYTTETGDAALAALDAGKEGGGR